MRFLLSKLRIFLFFPIPYLSQPLFDLSGLCFCFVFRFFFRLQHAEMIGVLIEPLRDFF